MVGKGITFDTGGLNLKPTGLVFVTILRSPIHFGVSGSMETMHLDKSGAAVTLASAIAAAQFKIPKNVGACCRLE